MLFKHLYALVPVIGISLDLRAAPPTPVLAQEISTAMATSRPNEWIIGFDNQPALTNLFSWAPSPLGLDFITVLPSIQGAVIKIPTFLESANIAGWIDTVRDLPGVRFIEPNDQVHLHRTIPNDALFSRQYGLANPGQPEGTAGKDIDAPLAWDVTTDARSNW